MKFVDLNTGYSFDGLWTPDQTKGYIFWFPNEQSVNITYAMTIAAVSDTEGPITITVEDNDIFSLVTHNNEQTTIDGYIFNAPIYSKSLTIAPEHVNEKYIYVFNVACKGANAGEYVCRINIGDEGYIRVGADLYGEYEPAYINLSNFGVEIPDTVQKAIYDSNVHEDITDNILVNRKFKELLSNYWDIIANKGSYKSLKNSLQWFEWDGNLNIREICKRDIADKSFFDDRELCSVLENKLEDSFTNFVKTTYVSLYCSMQDELDTYDSELNPELEKAIFKWSRNDMQLKLSLLAQFFGIYFMPIHVSILHATVEDKIFTNAIKTAAAGNIKRVDCFGDFNYIECNIKDDHDFRITNVKAQVSERTVFGVKYPDTRHFGVDVFPKDNKITDETIKTFALQYYAGPGVIIPIELMVPNQEDNDFIKHTIIDFHDERYEFYNKFKVINGRIKIKFNLLIKYAGLHNIRFTFIMASGKTLTRSIDISVEDAENLNINIYKIKSKDDSNGFNIEEFKDMTSCKYFFKTQDRKSNMYYHMRLPYMTPEHHGFDTYNGIKLTRTIVIDFTDKRYTNDEISFVRGIMSRGFLEFARYNGNSLKYIAFVSKKFYGSAPEALYNNIKGYSYNIIRNDLGFYPQFHKMEIMSGESIDNYTANQYEALCCVVEINHGSKTEEFRYGHMIDNAEWTFSNSVTENNIEYPASSLQPFIAEDSVLDTGYYNVKFRYSLTNGITNECSLNSAFRIKNT